MISFLFYFDLLLVGLMLVYCGVVALLVSGDLFEWWMLYCWLVGCLVGC